VSINIYEQMFINNQVGVAAAIAVVYLVFVIDREHRHREGRLRGVWD